MKHDEEHIDIRQRLLKLPKVKAKEGFENELMRRINLLETEKQPERRSAGIFDLLFGKKSLAWSVPAMSLTVVAVVVIGAYFIFYKTADLQKPQVSSNTVTEQTNTPSTQPPPVSRTEENKPGKEIANDFETGKSSQTDKKSEINRGFNETYIDRSPKMESKISTDELKTTEKNVRSSEDVMQKINQPVEKQEDVNKGAREEKKKEMPKKIMETEKKDTIEPDKNSDKAGKSDVLGKETGKDTNKSEKKKKSNKEKDLTKEILESISKKIKDNQ